MTELEHTMLFEMAADIKKLQLEIIELKGRLAGPKRQGEWYTMGEFCEIMKLSRYTVMERLRTGQYPWAVKDGKSWRFPAVQVNKITANLA